eukprot:c22582_g1_i1 orf=399-1796(-)
MATEGSAQPSCLDSLCYNLSNLHQLARQGSWRSLIDAISEARKLSLPHFPHEQLVHHAYLVLSHMKLRSYGDASLEIDALADLDSPQYQYQYYPDLYPQRTGSMVPFVLRWLHAELPYHLNQPSLTMERLYSLYDRCQQRIDDLLASDNSTEVVSNANTDRAAIVDDHHEKSELHQESVASPQIADLKNATAVKDLQLAGDAGEFQDPAKGISTSSNDNLQPAQAEPDSEFGDFVSGMNAAINDLEKSTKDGDGITVTVANLWKRWQQRQEFIMNCIVGHHLIQRDFVVVLKWFKQLLKVHPSDPWLLSKLGYVQMQMGDLSGASYTFSEVENIVSKTEVANSFQLSVLKGLVSRNKGLEHMVHKQYTEATKEFDTAMTMNPVDIVSANNKAMCYMYNRDLIGSTKVLESILDKAPLLALNESLVLNLCSMYELAFVHNVQTKKNLSDWIQQIAPGDFDFSCTRL